MRDFDYWDKLNKETTDILNETKANPRVLAKWLYENQGEMRFGAENRLFVVLIDTKDIHSSWKLKRNLDLLQPSIYSYLDYFSGKSISDLKIDFEFKGKPQSFTALTDIIFIMK